MSYSWRITCSKFKTDWDFWFARHQILSHIEKLVIILYWSILYNGSRVWFSLALAIFIVGRNFSKIKLYGKVIAQRIYILTNIKRKIGYKLAFVN